MNWDLTNVTLIGVDTIEGTNNGDTIIGSAGDDRIDGDFGIDTVDGGAGNDTLVLRDDGNDDNYAGGSGNDTFLVEADQMVNLNADSIDGGADTDTVSFEANSGSLTESQLVSVVSNVEVIDFSNAGINETLSLEGSQVQQMTDGNNVLRINVNAVGDDVTGVAGSGEFMQSNTSGSETIYTFYSDAGFTNQIAQLIVDEVA
jgi:Ca2+-binding RTX toxin-like protein